MLTNDTGVYMVVIGEFAGLQAKYCVKSILNAYPDFKNIYLIGDKFYLTTIKEILPVVNFIEVNHDICDINHPSAVKLHIPFWAKEKRIIIIDPNSLVTELNSDFENEWECRHYVQKKKGDVEVTYNIYTSLQFIELTTAMESFFDRALCMYYQTKNCTTDYIAYIETLKLYQERGYSIPISNFTTKPKFYTYPLNIFHDVSALSLLYTEFQKHDHVFLKNFNINFDCKTESRGDIKTSAYTLIRDRLITNPKRFNKSL